MTASPFDSAILSGLFGDQDVAALLSSEAELAEAARFEAALARAQGQVGLIPADAADAIVAACARFAPDMAALNMATARDGVLTPDYVAQLRGALSEPHRQYVHNGATSQDLIDTALVIRLKAISEIFDQRLEGLISALVDLEARFGTQRLMARTRMQDAVDIAVASRLADWRMPLERHRQRLRDIAPQVFVLQMGGAAGDRAGLGGHADAIAAKMAEELGLESSAKAWHSQRDGLYTFAGWLVGVSGSLGKLGQDVALMALSGREHVTLSGGGGSSAMPHKSNPVAAEVLVGLARYNGALVGGMGQALVHEQERSGAAWTLEWLALPQMLMTTGSGLLLAARLVGSIQSLGRP